MHILVTNDDGVQAPGLLALAQAMKSLGKVTVLAPDHNWSGAGHVKTLDRPLRVQETKMADGTPALMSDGAPSDCVALALLGLVENVDLVVSGINPYSNIGHDVTYSGTVTAAMEAVIAGVPGLAFSLASQDNSTGELPDYGPTAQVAAQVAKKVLERWPARRRLVEHQRPVSERIQRLSHYPPGTARLSRCAGPAHRSAWQALLLDRWRSSHRRGRARHGLRRAAGRVMSRSRRCNWI